MKIENNKFYIFKADDETNILETEEKALSMLKGKENFDNTEIIEVDMTEKEWTITQISWKKIAEYLVNKDEG